MSDDGGPGSGKRKFSVGASVKPEDDDDGSDKKRGKFAIKFLEDKNKRHITFSKRRQGILKKAAELSILTGTQVLLLVASESGTVTHFATPKFEAMLNGPGVPCKHCNQNQNAKDMIERCLTADDDDEAVDSGDEAEHKPQVEEDPSQAQQQAAWTQQTMAAYAAQHGGVPQQQQYAQYTGAYGMGEAGPDGQYSLHGYGGHNGDLSGIFNPVSSAGKADNS